MRAHKKTGWRAAIALTAGLLVFWGAVAPAAAATVSGVASWYNDGGGYYGAVNSYRWGDARYTVKVCRQDDPGRCVKVLVRDFCGCPGNRVIDLSPTAFRQLAPLSAGLVRVTVDRGAPAQLPPTDTEGSHELARPGGPLVAS